MRELTYHEAEAAAQEYATPISDLIGPKDIKSDAETWDDIGDEPLKREISQAADIVMSELGYHGTLKDLIYRRAVTIYVDSLPRVPFEQLRAETRQAAVKSGVWPYDVDKWTCYEIVMETRPSIDNFPSDIRYEAEEPVRSGLVEGMKPE